jgi:hypothetical protein
MPHLLANHVAVELIPVTIETVRALWVTTLHSRATWQIQLP